MNFDDMTINSIVKSLEGRGLQGEALEKAMHTAGLLRVKKEILVNGKPQYKSYWVTPNSQKQEKAEQYREEQKKQKEAKPGMEDHPTGGHSTKALHTDENGHYSDERHAHHKSVVKHVLSQADSAKEGHKPVAVLMGGGSASGKSTMRHAIIDKKLKEKGIKAATVDADEMKEHIPEYHHLKGHDPENAAKHAHEESADMTSMALDKLVKHKKHFVYDGTMSNPDRYHKLVDHLHKNGYEVHGYVADVPTHVAKKRSDERAKVTGRKVPHHVIDETHKWVPHTVESIKHKLDSYHVYDTQHHTPKLFASKHHVDAERYKQFLDKGKAKYNVRD